MIDWEKEWEKYPPQQGHQVKDDEHDDSILIQIRPTQVAVMQKQSQIQQKDNLQYSQYVLTNKTAEGSSENKHKISTWGSETEDPVIKRYIYKEVTRKSYSYLTSKEVIRSSVWITTN